MQPPVSDHELVPVQLLSKLTTADLIAAERAFAATALASGVTGKAWDGMYALRHAADFLDQAATHIAEGRAYDAQEIVEQFHWAAFKLAEFEALLPDEVRGLVGRLFPGTVKARSPRKRREPEGEPVSAREEGTPE